MAERGDATDAPVNRVLKAVGNVDFVDKTIGQTAGLLLGETGSRSVLK